MKSKRNAALKTLAMLTLLLGACAKKDTAPAKTTDGGAAPGPGDSDAGTWTDDQSLTVLGNDFCEAVKRCNAKVMGMPGAEFCMNNQASVSEGIRSELKAGAAEADVKACGMAISAMECPALCAMTLAYPDACGSVLKPHEGANVFTCD